MLTMVTMRTRLRRPAVHPPPHTDLEAGHRADLERQGAPCEPSSLVGSLLLRLVRVLGLPACGFVGISSKSSTLWTPTTSPLLMTAHSIGFPTCGQAPFACLILAFSGATFLLGSSICMGPGASVCVRLHLTLLGGVPLHSLLSWHGASFARPPADHARAMMFRIRAGRIAARRRLMLIGQAGTLRMRLALCSARLLEFWRHLQILSSSQRPESYVRGTLLSWAQT